MQCLAKNKLNAKDGDFVLVTYSFALFSFESGYISFFFDPEARAHYEASHVDVQVKGWLKESRKFLMKS
jgi:hypothetical protein